MISEAKCNGAEKDIRMLGELCVSVVKVMEGIGKEGKGILAQVRNSKVWSRPFDLSQTRVYRKPTKYR
jgi:hypothetical protein